MTTAMDSTFKPTLTHDELIKICTVCLRAGRLLAESGGRAHLIRECAEIMAKGMGAVFIGFRTGYASLSITLASGENNMTRMVNVSALGVNHRLDTAVRKLVARVGEGGMTSRQIHEELDVIQSQTPHHSPAVAACAVGLACASFGRLLGVDWLAFLPILVSSAAAQVLRHHMRSKNVNVYLIATMVALFGSFFSGLGARLMGSGTIDLAMMASVLLLVPGVPATNAQRDIMDGFPTLGSARAVSVLMIMIFMTTGVWIAEFLLGIHP